MPEANTQRKLVLGSNTQGNHRRRDGKKKPPKQRAATREFPSDFTVSSASLNRMGGCQLRVTILFEVRQPRFEHGFLCGALLQLRL